MPLEASPILRKPESQAEILTPEKIEAKVVIFENESKVTQNINVPVIEEVKVISKEGSTEKKDVGGMNNGGGSIQKL